MAESMIETDVNIESMIFNFRGEKVMVDRDLAGLYGIETKVLNQAVKRNQQRFEGFVFQLTYEEKYELVTNCDRFKMLKHSASKPYVFNEYGVLMLSSVLNSELAIVINRKIIKVFVDLRERVASKPDYQLLCEQVRRIEAEQEALKLARTVDNKMITDKINKLSAEVSRMSKILDEFQDSHLIIRRPDN